MSAGSQMGEWCRSLSCLFDLCPHIGLDLDLAPLMSRGKHFISSTRWEVAASNFKLAEWRHLKEICEVTKGSNCESGRKTVYAGKTEGARDRRMKCLLTPGFTATGNPVQASTCLLLCSLHTLWTVGPWHGSLEDAQNKIALYRHACSMFHISLMSVLL